MRHVWDKGFRESRNTFLFDFFFQNCAVYEIIWKNMIERGRPQMTIWRMRVACWIPEATNTHAGCAIFIAFHCNSGWTNTPWCYVIRTLSFLLKIWQQMTQKQMGLCEGYITVRWPSERTNSFTHYCICRIKYSATGFECREPSRVLYNIYIYTHTYMHTYTHIQSGPKVGIHFLFIVTPCINDINPLQSN